MSVVHESCLSESSKYLTEKLRLVNVLELDETMDFGEIYSLIQTGKSLKLLAMGLSDGRALGFPEVDRVKTKVKGEEQEVEATG